MTKKRLSEEKKEEIVKKIESGMMDLPQKDKMVEVQAVKWGKGMPNTKYLDNGDIEVTVEF